MEAQGSALGLSGLSAEETDHDQYMRLLSRPRLQDCAELYAAYESFAALADDPRAECRLITSPHPWNIVPIPTQ